MIPHASDTTVELSFGLQWRVSAINTFSHMREGDVRMPNKIRPKQITTCAHCELVKGCCVSSTTGTARLQNE